jgi:hypothetical protein
MSDLNAPRWDGGAGFYEVWYLTLTDRRSGVGAWIRYTLLAPTAELGRAPTASLWFVATDLEADRPVARKATFPRAELDLAADPFRVAIGPASLDADGMRGGFADVAWDLGWDRPGGAYSHVHPLLERAKIAKTILALPHADLAVTGALRIGRRELTLGGVRGGQAHLWGTKHASRWGWVHCNDFEPVADGDGDGPGAWVDGVSVWVPRLGREVGPSTPILARVGGRDIASISPLRVLANTSRVALTGWTFEARARGGRRLRGEVDAPREALAGVTYEDPDGARAYCYNTEVASMRLTAWEGDRLVARLTAPGRAHFEYAQREPVPGVEVLL